MKSNLACFDFFPSVLAKNEMASVGVEPTTFALLARRSKPTELTGHSLLIISVCKHVEES